MELLLLRHGIAADGVPDASRPLTPAGIERTSAVLHRLLALDLGCALLFSSPLLRARQTAELAVAAGLAPALQLAPALAPGGDAAAWLQQQAAAPQCAAVNRLALVGHEPDLSALAAALIGAPRGSLQLKKAGVIVLNWQPPAGAASLQWLASPRLLLG
ncbi:MAG: phosphohistidine phosphatase SixA [Cyanobacteria bacterium K_DeepCast_35m_m2_155]|nr:phosphohistidine phosphatase SixA [Cyanobacteria bacterium K_DeepCast_35m_m2_155]